MPATAIPADTLPPSERDLPLATAKAFLMLPIGLLIFAMVMVAIGTGVVLTVRRAELLGEIVAAGAPGHAYWLIIALLLLVEGALYLGLRFMLELRRIVISVERGDPFHYPRAERLARMVWLALAIWIASIPVSLIGVWLTPQIVATGRNIRVGGEFGVESLLLILTLFVLVRAFRHGAAMREELEGTV